MRSCRLVICWQYAEGEADGGLLFCPTVGPILSGDSPGVSLYSVLIFSSKVCDTKLQRLGLAVGDVAKNGYRFAGAIETDDDDREFLFPEYVEWLISRIVADLPRYVFMKALEEMIHGRRDQTWIQE